MKQPITIIEENITFSPYYFYNSFIKRVAQFYTEDYDEDIIRFMLLDTSIDYTLSNIYIDPISLPLLLSLAEQLKKFHNNKPLELYLLNTYETIELLEFLDKADFFHIVGDNENPSFPIGKNIFKYDETYIGGFKGKKQYTFHKVRGYSLSDTDLSKIDYDILNEKEQTDYRDSLIQFYSIKVEDHFSELLFNNVDSDNSAGDFIKILSELISNGVLHSKSDVYVLMFSDNYNTKFSISDNGIGLFESLKKKKTIPNYDNFTIYKRLSANFFLKVTKEMKESVLSIFEALYYSMLKDRYGLFDLMCKVVIENNGYFRLHNNNSQLIISHRMINELVEIYEYRNRIIEIHNKLLFGVINKDEHKKDIKELAQNSMDSFVKLAMSIFQKYSKNIRFSSMRFYDVRFKGVHIEVELPNIKN